jgi:predicted dehydrogenase
MNSKGKSMKVAVLGLGAMGSTVIGHLKECKEVSTIKGYDNNKERIKEMQEKSIIQATLDLNEILSDNEVKLVFVTASNHAHKDLTMKALRAGKAVLCEKPIAITLSDAEEVVSFAEREKLFLQIGFEARYSKLYTKVKEWIDAGLIGDIVNTHCTYISSEYWGKDSWRVKNASSGSMFGEKLCHYVDLPRWWVGKQVKDVYTACAPNMVPYYEVHDNYNTVYRFENGATSSLTFMMALASTFIGDPLQNAVTQQKGDGHELRFLVAGTKGAAETDVFNRYIKRWQFRDVNSSFKSDLVEKLTWPEEEDHFYFHNTTDQTKDIVKRVAKGLGPKTPARDALETMKLCFAAEKSARSGNIETI